MKSALRFALLLLVSTQVQSPAAQKAGQRWLKQWTIKTADTTVGLGVSSAHELYLTKLSGPAGWDWAAKPSPFPLLPRAQVGGTERPLHWTFIKEAKEKTDGATLQLSFSNTDPALELVSIWEAHPGPGPVRHSMFIKNLSPQVVTIFNQESLELQVMAPAGETRVCYINDDASIPDPVGVYRDRLRPGYQKLLPFSEGLDFIPFALLDANAKEGIYVGWEWTIGRMLIASSVKGVEASSPGTSSRGGEVPSPTAPQAASLKLGNGDQFKTDLQPGEVFVVPPAFLGAYAGDMDDAGNSLRKYLFRYSMPRAIRDDPSFPKVEWNAFAATGKGQGSWDSTETKYYPLIDEIAPLGFEEVVLDVGWWQGDTTHKPHPPVGDPVDWASGMLAARNYAHDRGMRFGLYWNCNPSMTTTEGMKHRQDDTRYLFEQFRIDFFRSDGTDGNVVQTGGFGSDMRAHYAEDAGYWQTKDYYEVLDSLYATITNYSYECCSGGGRLKDYGILKRAFKIQNQDRYYPLDARQSFYDASFALHPMQLAALCGSWAESQAAGSVFEFRSCSMGAADWHPDAPGGRNGGPVWSSAQRESIQQAVNTYKTMIRPLVRTANLYHIFPRPTGKIWDGIEYFDPQTRKGAVFVFRPEAPEPATTVRLKGLKPRSRYWLWCADQTFEPMQSAGSRLMETGFTLALPQINMSEIVFFQDASLGKPSLRFAK